MKPIYSIVLALCASAFLSTGCIRDDENTDCTRISNLVIRIVDEQGRDITTSETVTQARLYLFCSQDKYLTRMEIPIASLRAREPIRLEYPDHAHLTAVVWCNIDCPHITVDEVNASHTTASALNIFLKGAARAKTVYNSPRELFHGKLVIQMPQSGVGASNSSEIVATRKVSSMKVTAIGLHKAFPADDADLYRFEVCGTADSFELVEGCLCSTAADATFAPEVFFDGVLHSTALFNTFPSRAGNGVTAKIYRGEELVYAASKDRNGNDLVAAEGRTLLIDIDFTTGVTVKAGVVPWGDLEQIISQ